MHNGALHDTGSNIAWNPLKFSVESHSKVLREYRRPALSFCQSAPHHLTHPSGLVSSSLFFRFHSCPLAAKPRPRLVDHAPNDHCNSNRLKAGHSLFPILYNQDRLDPVALSFPGLDLQSSSHTRPTNPLAFPRHILPAVSIAAHAPVYSCSCPSPKNFPCRILGHCATRRA